MKKKFEEYSDRVLPGMILLGKFYDTDGFFLTEAAFSILDVLPHKEGIVVEAGFGGASKKAPSDLQNVRSGSENLLLLQRYAEPSLLVKSRPGFQATTEWKSCYLNQLVENWTSSGVRAKLRDHFRSAGVEKLSTTSRSSMKTTPAGRAPKAKLPLASKVLKSQVVNPFPPIPPPPEEPPDELRLSSWV